MDLSGYEHGTAAASGAGATTAGASGLRDRATSGLSQGGSNSLASTPIAGRGADEGAVAGSVALYGGASNAGASIGVCADGVEGCHCYGNGTCNIGLSCSANVCVVGGRAGGANNGGAGPARGGAGGFGGVLMTAGRAGQGGTLAISGAASTGGTNRAGAATSVSGGAMASGGTAAAGTTTSGTGSGGVAGASSRFAAGAGTAGNGMGGASSGGSPPCASFAATGCSYAPSSSPSCPSLTASCHGESCCTVIAMPGGTFPMGRTSEDCGPLGCEPGAGYEGCPVGASCDLNNERPEHSATVSDFALDKYEVTVGRFRGFVNAYDAWHKDQGYPKEKDGAHPIAAHTGWAESWSATSADLPTTAESLRAMLICDDNGNNTWTNQPTSHESYPINCVSWYVAFAFCIWDGGRLPTEAEWEYASAGGARNRLYPWGSAGPDAAHANYAESSPSGSLFNSVGSRLPNGAGLFGHADLAGSVAEWVFDWFAHEQYHGLSSCENCVNADPSNTDRGCRGGGWLGGVSLFRAAARTLSKPSDPYHALGFRCARKIP